MFGHLLAEVAARVGERRGVSEDVAGEPRLDPHAADCTQEMPG